jgi:hypothetical protein
MSAYASRQQAPAGPSVALRRVPARGGQTGRFRIGRAADAAERQAVYAADLATRPGGRVVPTAASAGAGEAVPAGLNQPLRALDGSGTPLPAALRAEFEPRFATDFSAVRVHADPSSAALAANLGARAFAVGPHLVFGHGEYAPDAAPGRGVIAHELAHVAQHAAARDAGTIHRLSYADIKEKAVAGLTSGLHAAENAAMNRLRKLAADHLPPGMMSAANGLIEIMDLVLGAIFAVIIAVVGLVTGFGEGVVSMITGLVTLGYGVLKLLYDLISGIFTNFDAAKNDLNLVWEALKALPAAIKKLTADWLDAFGKASSERQSFMIGELTGQILALIATFAATAGRAGTAARIGGEAGDAGRTGGVVADASSTAAKARPALRVIEGGGEGSARASAGTAFPTEGSAALKPMPAFEPAPAPPPLRLVPPPAAEPVQAAAGTGARAGSKAATGLATAAKLADAAKKNAPEPFVMRMQVQWDSKNKGPTFSSVATAAADPGVTTIQAVTHVQAALDQVQPRSARDAAEPAAALQRKWILGRPPAGIAQQGWSRSEYFPYQRYTDARVDVENLHGHNLRV